MENDKETILRLFNNGATIKGLTDMLYSQAKDREKAKNRADRVKVNALDIKNLVERTIYESRMNKASQKENLS